MNLEFYAISAVCQYEEAAVHAITKLKPHDFTEANRKAFKIATGLFKIKRRVDQHVFASQLQGVGYAEADAALLYHYCLDYDDDWKNNLEELKRQATYRTIGEHVAELNRVRAEQAEIPTISAKAMQYASEWITGTEKRYFNGKEIDEMPDIEGDPIKTGHILYDHGLYQHGGNQKGQMKGVILREKHGKTRSECWEVAQNIRMGHKVLYLALEGRKTDITGNVKQILRHEWKDYREHLFVVDGVVDLDELEAIVTEAVLVDGVEKVVVDYMQLVVPSGRYSNENEKINVATERFRHLMVRHNFHCVALNQARKESQNAAAPKDAQGNQLMPGGYRFVPSAYDAYGSNALVKAATLILVGFRPNQYQELITHNQLGQKVVDPHGAEAGYYSLFMKMERTRNKPDNLHRWYQFTDSDEGLKLTGWT